MKFGKNLILLALIISFIGCVSSNKNSYSKKYYEIKAVKTDTNEIKYIKGKQVLISNQKQSNVWIYPYMNSVNVSEENTLFFGIIVQNISAQKEILISINDVKAQTGKYKMLVLNHNQASDYLNGMLGENTDLSGLDPEDVYTLMALKKRPTHQEQKQKQQIFKILNERYFSYETIAPNNSYEGMFLTSLPQDGNKFGIRVSILDDFHDFYFYFQ